MFYYLIVFIKNQPNIAVNASLLLTLAFFDSADYIQNLIFVQVTLYCEFFFWCKVIAATNVEEST